MKNEIDKKTDTTRDLIQDLEIVDTLLRILPFLISTLFVHAALSSKSVADYFDGHTFVFRCIFVAGPILLWVIGVTLIGPKVYRITTSRDMSRYPGRLESILLGAGALILATTVDIVIIYVYFPN